MALGSVESKVIQNSDLRDLTAFADSGVEKFHEKFPWVKPLYVTIAGAAFSATGIELAEHQNRTHKHTLKGTMIALACLGIGGILDLLDGKLATVIRSRMQDGPKRDRHENFGQVIDPVFDGGIEALEAIEAARTAKREGNRFGVAAALLQLATINIPRTAKAFAGVFGKKVPETYRAIDLFTRGDIRVLGNSLGRKGPNWLAAFVHTVKGVPIQGMAHATGALANGIVTAERVGIALNPDIESKLTSKQIYHAKWRTAILGAESVACIGLAYYFGRKLLSNQKNNTHQK